MLSLNPPPFLLASLCGRVCRLLPPALLGSPLLMFVRSPLLLSVLLLLPLLRLLLLARRRRHFPYAHP